MNESEMMSTTPAMVFDAISERESFVSYRFNGNNDLLSALNNNDNINNNTNNNTNTNNHIAFSLESEMATFAIDETSPFRETFVGLPPPPMVGASGALVHEVSGHLQEGLEQLARPETPLTTENTVRHVPIGTPVYTAPETAASSSKNSESGRYVPIGTPVHTAAPAGRINQPKSSKDASFVSRASPVTAAALTSNVDDSADSYLPPPSIAHTSASSAEPQEPPQTVPNKPPKSPEQPSLPLSQTSATSSNAIANNGIAFSAQNSSQRPPLQATLTSSNNAPLAATVASTEEFPSRTRGNRKEKKEPSASMVPTLTPKTGNPFAPSSSSANNNGSTNHSNNTGNASALLSAAIPAMPVHPPSNPNLNYNASSNSNTNSNNTGTNSSNISQTTPTASSGLGIGGGAPARRALGRPNPNANTNTNTNPSHIHPNNNNATNSTNSNDNTNSTSVTPAANSNAPVIGGGTIAARNRKPINSSERDKISLPTLDKPDNTAANPSISQSHSAQSMLISAVSDASLNNNGSLNTVGQPTLAANGLTQRMMFPKPQPSIASQSGGAGLHISKAEDSATIPSEDTTPAVPSTRPSLNNRTSIGSYNTSNIHSSTNTHPTHTNTNANANIGVTLPSLTSFNEACQWLNSVSVSPVNFKLLSEELIHVNLKYLRGLLSQNKESFRKFSTADRCDVVTKLFKRYCAVSALVTEECLGLVVALCKASGEQFDSVDSEHGANEENIKLFGLNGCLTDLIPALAKFGKPTTVAPTSSPSTSLGIVKHGLVVIRQLASNSHHNATLGRLGACECVVDLLFHYIHHVDVVAEGLTAIMNLAHNADNTQRLCNNTGSSSYSEVVTMAVTNCCKVIPLALLRHSGDLSVAQWGCLAIVNLASDDANAHNNAANAHCRLQLGRNGACDTLLNLLGDLTSDSNTGRTSSQCAAVVQYVCLAIATIAQSYENRLLFSDSLQQLPFLRVFELFANHQSVVEQALSAIGSLVLDCSENQSKLGCKSPELCSAIVRIMNNLCANNANAINAIEKGLLTIQRLTFGHFANRLCFVEQCGVYDAVFECLKVFVAKQPIDFNDDTTEKSKEKLISLRLVCIALKVMNGLNELSIDPSVPSLVVKPGSIICVKRPNELIATICTAVTAFSSANASSVNSSDVASLMEQVFRLVRYFSFLRSHHHLFAPSVDTSISHLCDPSTGQLLVRSMERHISDERVIAIACEAIAELADSDNSSNTNNARSVLGTSKACFVVVQVLNCYAHTNHPSVVQAALRAVAAIARGHKENCTLFGVEGACEVITASMRRHIHNGEVIRQGADAIVQVALQDATNLSQLVYIAGVCDLLVQATFIHLTDAAICSHLMRTVYAICALNTPKDDAKDDSQHTSSAHKMKLNDARVCSAVVALLHCHSCNGPSLTTQGVHAATTSTASEAVLPWVFRVMGSLAAVDALRSKFGAVTVCTLVVKSLHWQQQQQQQQSGANSTLTASSSGGNSNVLDGELAHAGYLAMGNIACDPEYAATLGQLGACEALVQSLKVHFADAAVAEQCLWAMKNLSALDINQERFYELGTPAIIIRALRTHIECEHVVERCFEVIANLCCYGKNRVAFGEAGACSLVCDGFKLYIGSVSSAFQGCCAIGNLAFNNQDNRKKLAMCQVNDLLKNFHMCYMDHEACNEKYQTVFKSVNPN